jgi:hypothetical protein
MCYLGAYKRPEKQIPALRSLRYAPVGMTSPSKLVPFPFCSAARSRLTSGYLAAFTFGGSESAN